MIIMIIQILTLCVICLFVGYQIGYLRATIDWNKIIDIHKDTIENYRKALRGKYG